MGRLRAKAADRMVNEQRPLPPPNREGDERQGP
jgi:hypothetical protein